VDLAPDEARQADTAIKRTQRRETELSTSDETPYSNLDEPSLGSGLPTTVPLSSPPSKRAPPPMLAASTVRRRPKNLLELVSDAIEDSGRTCRLAILIATTGLCLTAIVFVVQLRPERWVSVAAAATSVITITSVDRRRRYRHSDSGGGAILRPSRRRDRRRR
jgi:hypothetical protein